MVQHQIDVISPNLNSFNINQSDNVADVIGSNSSLINNKVNQHARALGSMHVGSVDFVSNVLSVPTLTDSSMISEQIPLNTMIKSSSNNCETVISHSSKSHKPLFSRLKRLINFQSRKKINNYSLSSKTNSNNQINVNSPVLSHHKTFSLSTSKQNSSSENRQNSFISTKRTLSTTTQHIPFLYGLKNCGNTCYINAIIQCLCHTEQIALYIRQKTFEIDMRNIKHVSSSIRSSSYSFNNFRITKIFIQIFQALWNNSSNRTTKLLYDFKSMIENLNKQYSGNEQNDAQEFLLFLINTIHDELNLTTNKRTKQENKNSSPSLDQSSTSIDSTELAERAWSNYIDVNQSIITSTFAAQLHSTLRCNQCKKESKTFEPYLLLSLPIPLKNMKSVFITVVFLNQSPKQLQIGLCLPMTSTVKDVRETIAQQSNLDPNDLVLIEIKPNEGFSKVFHDRTSLTYLTDHTYAIQFPSKNLENPSTIVENLSISYADLLVLNRVRTKTGEVERFGAPIVVRVPIRSSYGTLQLSILEAQPSLIQNEILDYAQEHVLFQLAFVDSNQTIKQENQIFYHIQRPLYLEKILNTLHTYDEPGFGPPHLEIYATWQEKHLNEYLPRWTHSIDTPDIHQSVSQARSAVHRSSSSSSITLADCFSLFTQSESLNYDDAWMCTHCSRKENGSVKHLEIWTTPPILIIHFKRFRQTKISNVKLTYPIQFPLVNFDIKKFLSTTNHFSNVEDNQSESYDEQNQSIDNEDERQYGFYDLYAVCNHRGTMLNGHYTAYCKNPVTNKWFCYDDHFVSEIDSSYVCTPDAYILFYKRRDISLSSEQIDSMIKNFDERLSTISQTEIITNPKIFIEKINT